MDETYKLNEVQHEKIFKQLKSEMLANTKPSIQPAIVILGGQPGSGKSQLINIAKATLLADREPAIINGDEYRDKHPQKKEILQADDKKYAERTDPDVRDWTKRLFDTAIENRRDIIFEGTMRNKEPIMSTIQNLKESGYKVHVMTMAVQGEVSRVGTVFRYEGQKAKKGYGRWVDPESHNQAYKNMPDTVRSIEKESPLESITVYNRDYKAIYKKESKNGIFTRPSQTRDAAAEIIKERMRPFSKETRDKFNIIRKKIEVMMKQRNAATKEITQAKIYMIGVSRNDCEEKSR